MDTIFTGISTFEAKVQRGTLPKDCPPERYLGGIIRNVEQREFLEPMGRNLLEHRLEVRDR
ncbi:MAG TPA: hypothetical protein PKL24_21775 [Polyangiaceae bacterium]|nr:hypothetical protein [Polyangiaceae bacterium]